MYLYHVLFTLINIYGVDCQKKTSGIYLWFVTSSKINNYMGYHWIRLGNTQRGITLGTHAHTKKVEQKPRLQKVHMSDHK
jgi:hypothetical protein